MQKVKHELQVSRKKAEEERIRREMAAQNAEITDLTGSEPNSRDDTRPFCKGWFTTIFNVRQCWIKFLQQKFCSTSNAAHRRGHRPAPLLSESR